MKYWPPKPPADIADYLFRFVDDLESGETIVSESVTATGVIKVSDAIADVVDETPEGEVTTTAAGVRVWLSGGTFGATATVSCLVTTSGGRTYSATAVLPIGEEPVSLDQAKQQCRIIDDTSEDALISGYIRAAREFVERDSGHILVRRQITDYRSCFGRFIEINDRPVISVDSVEYTDSSGTLTAYPDFVVRTARGSVRIYPALNGYWPTLARNGEISVTFTAGYEPGTEPPQLLQAILLLVGHWFANREAVSIEAATPAEVPFAVRALLDQFRALIV